MELSKNEHTVQVLGKYFKPYIWEEQLLHRIGQLADQLNSQYADKDPLFVGVLNGSFMFFSDLMKAVHIKSKVSFVKVASYAGTETTGKVNELIGLNESIEGRHLILVEDIVDTGITLTDVLSRVNAQHPASVTVAALLFKPSRLRRPVKPDYIGFEVPDNFLLGYGLDYDGYGRNLRHIYAEVKA
jgi:hypoxanthine phosphoribosyltransferase